MHKTGNEMPAFEGMPTIVQREDGGISFGMKDKEGETLLIRYQVFPGIDLICNDIHMKRSNVNVAQGKRHVIEIDHCRDGRMECYAGNNYFYLAPGDIVLHQLGDTDKEEIFPTGHYHGITIQIDLKRTPECLASFMEDVDVEPKRLVQKFQLNKNYYYALRQMPSVEHIFSELYALPESVKKGYFKVKILELFLFLNGLEKEENRLEQRKFSETQVILAQNVCSYLTEHIEKHITIAELAEQFGVSTTQIKNSFNGIYGTSVYSYMRSQRMQAAAKLLRQTDRTVLDIAGQFGYENGSKFANAFRTVMGVTPTQYRNGRYHTE